MITSSNKFMGQKIYTLFTILFTSIFCSAQITFQKTYGLRTNNQYNSDNASSGQQTMDGGYIFAGASQSPYDYSSNAYLVKTDNTGYVLWSKTYGSGTEVIYSVKQTSDSGYILAGYTAFGIGNGIYLVKTNANGDTLWTAKIGIEGYALIGNSIELTNDSGYIVTGEIDELTGPDHDQLAFLLKTDLKGNILWMKTYERGTSNASLSVKQTQDSCYIIAGYTNDDIFLIKTNVNGDTVWTKRYGNASSNKATSVIQTSDGGYALTGYYNEGIYAGVYDVPLLKIDANGNLQWVKRYRRVINGNGNSFTVNSGNSIEQTQDGGYIIAGGSGDITVSTAIRGLYLIKTNGSGDMLWSKIYGGNNSGNAVFSIHQTKDKGYIIAGVSQSDSLGQQDALLIKTDSNGISGCNEYSPETVALSAVLITNSGATVASITPLLENSFTLVNSPSTETMFLCSALPLIWGSFTAEKNNNTTLLKWNALQEFNTSQYNIERSTGGSHFYIIGSLKAAGITNLATNYHFNDSVPLQGVNFYRLKQVDKDGNFTYSNVISINFDKQYSLSISPVPAHDVVTLKGAENFTEVQFIDASGRIIKQFGKMPNNTFPVAELGNGVYYIRLLSKNSSQVLKMIKE